MFTWRKNRLRWQLRRELILKQREIRAAQDELAAMAGRQSARYAALTEHLRVQERIDENARQVRGDAMLLATLGLVSTVDGGLADGA